VETLRTRNWRPRNERVESNAWKTLSRHYFRLFFVSPDNCIAYIQDTKVKNRYYKKKVYLKIVNYTLR
jgi:hypothetical protein